jgi:hypothetical protein
MAESAPDRRQSFWRRWAKAAVDLGDIGHKDILHAVKT